MNIFSVSGVLDEKNDKTNVCHKFCVPENAKGLKVSFSYSPKLVEGRARAEALVEQALRKYKVRFADKSTFMPVKNLITLSFDENGNYRGACHRQPNEQTIYIKEKNSTFGIINRPVESGEWQIVLNVHFAGCEIKYNIDIEEAEEV